MKKTKLKSISGILVFLMISQIIAGVLSPLNLKLFPPDILPQEVSAAGESWYSASWLNRKPVDITGSTAGIQTDYQVNITVAYDADMQADFDDIRFTDSDGITLLSHWRESYTASTTASFWVKIPSIPASPSTVTIYMYYGNAGAASASSGDNTFSFFDDFEPQSWQALAVMPSARADHMAVSLNSKIYLIGGYDAGATDARAEAWEYDPVGNAYTQKTSMNVARWGAMAVPFNGKIYVFGGQGLSANEDLYAELYDPALNTWTNKAKPPAAIKHQGIFGAADASYIYLFYNNNLYRYNPSDDTYTLLDSTPPNNLTSWGIMAIYNNKIYIIGGYSGGAVGNVMIYNLGTSGWEANGTSMPVSLYGILRENPIIGDNIYIIQGQRGDGEFFSRFWKYNITSNSWSWGRLGYWDADGVVGGVIGNKIYTFGGRRIFNSPVGTNFAGVLDTSSSDASARWIDIKTANWRIDNGVLVAGSSLNTVPQLRTANTVTGGGGNKIISKMKYAGGSTGFGGLMLQSNGGLYYNTDNSYLSPYMDITANKDWLLRETSASFPASTSTTPVSTVDTWHNFITTFDTSTVTQTRDGGSAISLTDSTYRSGYIQIFKTSNLHGSGNISLQVDYVAVSSYVSPEPSAGAFGAEELYNAAPSVPVLVSPANASYTSDTTPTLSANYSDSDTGDVGTTNYRITSGTAQNCLDNVSVVASGTSSATVINSEATAWTPSSSIGLDATYYWCAQNNDGVATSSWTSMGNFILDTTAPTGTTLGFGAIATDSITATVSSATDGSGSGLHATPYYFENTIAGTNSGWTADTSWISSSLSCSITYFFRIKTRDTLSNESVFTGLTSTATQNCPGGGLPIVVYNPPVAPQITVDNSQGGFNIFINNNAFETNTKTVILKLNAGFDTARMAISNTSDFAGAIQEPFQPTKPWTLSAGDGVKTVYVKFYTQYGVASEAIQSSIILNNFSFAPELPSLVRASNGYKVYLIKNNQKQWIKTSQEFISLGYDWNQVAVVAPEQLSFYPDDVLNNPFFFSRNLKPGDRGSDVKELQKLLNNKGFIVSPNGPGSLGSETEIFGYATRKALVKFQKVNNIPATGYFGPITRKAI